MRSTKCILLVWLCAMSSLFADPADEVDILLREPEGGVRACYFLVKTYLDSGEPDKALVASTRLLELRPDDSKASGLHGFAYYAKGDYRQAFPFLKVASEGEMQSAYSPLLLSYVALDMKIEAGLAASKVYKLIEESADFLKVYLVYLLKFDAGKYWDDDKLQRVALKYSDNKEVRGLIEKFEALKKQQVVGSAEAPKNEAHPSDKKKAD